MVYKFFFRCISIFYNYVLKKLQLKFYIVFYLLIDGSGYVNFI